MPRTSSLHYAVRHGLHLPEEPGVHFRQTTKLPAASIRARRRNLHRPTGQIGVRPRRRPASARPPVGCSTTAGDEARVRSTSCWPSATSCVIQVATAASAFGDVGASRRGDSGAVSSRGRPRRGVARPRCARRASGTGGARCRRGCRAHRPWRCRRQVGRRARHPSRAPHRSKVTPATRGDTAVSTRSIGRSSQSAKQTWTTSIDWLPSWRRCITLDAGACRTIRVFSDGRVDRRHSVDRKHSGGVGSGSGGGG